MSLRAARAARGWSQADAAGELVALGRASGTPVAAAASLKTLLSRWENGHALPEPHYRTLLAELYGRTPGDLGIAVAPAADATTASDRLRSAIAAAAAVDHTGLELWWEQLAVASRLDDELGAAGAGELVRALVEQLEETLIHTLTPARRSEVAAVLAGAATLAGAQELDRARPDEAWRRYDRARSAAREAGVPEADAVAGQAAVLVDVGEPATAVELLDLAGPATGDPAQVRLDAARAVASAAAGDSPAAHHAIAAAARRLQRSRVDIVALRGGPVLDLADLHRWHGRTLVALGDAEAVGPLERALDPAPRSARHRAAVHADLALALAAHRPEDAAEHARRARELALRIGSEQVGARLAALRARA
ncbi:helix-turn-helix domain-containing protein [Pseudonocardia alaniniphila]|uniref:Helix-turn-helix domain-containing protein n=1 Tax=Pseudonocardia alaniniphila TaxID=75291 RepID=A0ABS9TBH9_9PSEU|nr:helix-turn-helix domain-containing protein [Pseudonocardia alaniniphila]MCH6165901.1 helix-turn-helix domain-containing protein [Pseudonocardia alaniniphila]